MIMRHHMLLMPLVNFRSEKEFLGKVDDFASCSYPNRESLRNSEEKYYSMRIIKGGRDSWDAI